MLVLSYSKRIQVVVVVSNARAKDSRAFANGRGSPNRQTLRRVILSLLLRHNHNHQRLLKRNTHRATTWSITMIAALLENVWRHQTFRLVVRKISDLKRSVAPDQRTSLP
jgi:hypothetical protein